MSLDFHYLLSGAKMACRTCGKKKIKRRTDRKGNYFDKYRYLKPNQLEKKKRLEEERDGKKVEEDK